MIVQRLFIFIGMMIPVIGFSITGWIMGFSPPSLLILVSFGIIMSLLITFLGFTDFDKQIDTDHLRSKGIKIHGKSQ
jgi:hypothetical protein